MAINRLSKILIIGGLATSFLMANNVKNDCSKDKFIKSMLQKVMPNTKIEKYKKSIIDGFYTVFLKNGNVLYINPFKEVIFFGSIWTKEGYSITQYEKQQWQKELDDKIKSEIKFDTLTKYALKVKKNQNSKYSLIVFTDPVCPFCVKLENYLKDKKVDVFVNYLFAVKHKFQKELALGALKLKNKDVLENYLKDSLKIVNDYYKKQKNITKKTIDDLYKKYNIVKNFKNEENILSKMQKIANDLSLRGTPMIYIFDKKTNKLVKFVRGANIKEIENIIKK